MPIRAYVFVESTLGRATQVADALAKLPGVEMAHAVTDAYDVIAFVEAASLSVLGELISQRIHQLPGVLKTTTNVVVEGAAGNGPAGARRRGKRA